MILTRLILSGFGLVMAVVCVGLTPFTGWTFLMWVGIVMFIWNGAMFAWALVHRARLRPREPEPPENVRIVVGVTEIPVQCVYRGCEAGIDVWEVIRPRALTNVEEITGVRVDVFPPRSRIAIVSEPTL